MLPSIPDEFQPQRFMTHSDERVRREALKLLLRLPELRAQTIIAALVDRDDSIVQAGDARPRSNDCPKGAMPLLVRHVERKIDLAGIARARVARHGAARDEPTLPWLMNSP